MKKSNSLSCFTPFKREKYKNNYFKITTSFVIILQKIHLNYRFEVTCLLSNEGQFKELRFKDIFFTDLQ